MKTSWPDNWHIDHLKIVGYLLNVAHKDRQAKAEAFLGFGFDVAEPDRLALPLVEHIVDKVPQTIDGRYGARFVFEGPVLAQVGLIPCVRSVWLMRPGA